MAVASLNDIGKEEFLEGRMNMSISWDTLGDMQNVGNARIVDCAAA